MEGDEKVTEEINVPALFENGELIIGGTWLGKKPVLRTTQDNCIYSAIEVQSLNPPTIAELRHAFFDKNPDGSWVSPEYRQSVLSSPVSGEWTSTFVLNGNTLVVRPELIEYDAKHGIWVAHGYLNNKIELPPNGFVLEYDKLTGLPSRTSSKEEGAEKIFGGDRSYFRRTESSLNPVLRDYVTEGLGPFCITLYDSPTISHRHWGARSSRYTNWEGQAVSRFPRGE